MNYGQSFKESSIKTTLQKKHFQGTVWVYFSLQLKNHISYCKEAHETKCWSYTRKCSSINFSSPKFLQQGINSWHLYLDVLFSSSQEVILNILLHDHDLGLTLRPGDKFKSNSQSYKKVLYSLPVLGFGETSNHLCQR